MKSWVAVLMAGLIFPNVCFGQNSGGLANGIKSLREVLDELYTEMIPLCGDLIGVGRAIAGFAATWYIAARVWRHIANAEPVDFYPLFRPFVLGFAILVFPSVLAMINGVMNPTVTGTGAMLENSDKAIARLLQEKEEAIKETIYWQMYVGTSGDGNYDKWYQYTYKEDVSEENWLEGIGNSVHFAVAKSYYNLKNSINELIAAVLKVLFEAAALCINTIRTFFLVVLAVLGPIVFGLAVFDGFQNTLAMWLARYINVFLWLPVANIFGTIIGKVQENMLKRDIGEILAAGNTFFNSADVAYFVFMIIGIIGYFTVPTVANYIMQTGGAGAFAQKVTSVATWPLREAARVATTTAKMATG